MRRSGREKNGARNKTGRIIRNFPSEYFGLELRQWYTGGRKAFIYLFFLKRESTCLNGGWGQEVGQREREREY